MNLAFLANRIWIASQRAEYKKFLSACKNPEQTQLKKLKSYIKLGRNTQFGRRYHFEKIDTYQQFTEQVPIQIWDDIQIWIDKILKNESSVLTPFQLLAFEETSGTTSMAKLVPYTQLLRDEFQAGVGSWIHALNASNPKVFSGPSYWSISPATREKRTTPTGISIGLESDGEYFNFFTRFLLSKIWAVSPAIARESDPEKFYSHMLAELLLQEKLSFISVWSPSFMIQMDSFLRENKDRILESIEFDFPHRGKRINHLKRALEGDFLWKDLFPKLQMLSCWTHAQAGISLPDLKSRLGSIPIQPKGLLSTEGITSIPILPELDPVLSIRSHFYEFRSLNSKKVFLAHQLVKGESYEVILTTGGGLHRYASGDFVQVTGFFHSAPCLKFLGRGNQQSDLVGEKLSEPQLIQAIQQIPQHIQENITNLFFTSLPNRNRYSYHLLVAMNDDRYSSPQLAQIGACVEKELKRNPYYAQAIKLNQLSALEVQAMKQSSCNKLRTSLQKRRKIKDGDFKMPLIIPQSDLKAFIQI